MYRQTHKSTQENHGTHPKTKKHRNIIGKSAETHRRTFGKHRNHGDRCRKIIGNPTGILQTSNLNPTAILWTSLITPKEVLQKSYRHPIELLQKYYTHYRTPTDIFSCYRISYRDPTEHQKDNFANNPTEILYKSNSNPTDILKISHRHATLNPIDNYRHPI